ncbi:MAG: hypothetical protein LAP40_17965 [Acidobacteriia bacterium]|nr:hypothetical protein [Terriglobia bacterium]
MNHASISHTRRELLFGMAGAALAVSQTRNQIYNPRLLGHTSIWLREAVFRNRRLDEMAEEAFDSMQRAGYRRVELASEFLAPGLRNRTLVLLRKQKLQAAIVDASGPLYERREAEATRAQVLEMAGLMEGWDTGFLNFSPAGRPDRRPKTASELETQAYQLNRMGQDLRQTGMGLMVHHDLAEMQDNAREWRYTRANTETGLVSFCLDVDSVTRAGLRPVPLMDEAGARLRNLHLRNPRGGVDQEFLREGDINMVEIARFLRRMSYDGFLTVELSYDRDTQRQHSLTEDLSRSRWYMQDIFGSRPGSAPVDMGPHVRERKG